MAVLAGDDTLGQAAVKGTLERLIVLLVHKHPDVPARTGMRQLLSACRVSGQASEPAHPALPVEAFLEDLLLVRLDYSGWSWYPAKQTRRQLVQT